MKRREEKTRREGGKKGGKGREGRREEHLLVPVLTLCFLPQMKQMLASRTLSKMA